MEPIGKAAYDAYRQRLAKAQEGKPFRQTTEEWEDLLPEEREAWQAAADTVAEFYA